MKADVQTIDAKKAGSVELADHIFGLEPRVDIIHRVIQWQLNKRQQGTHQAKSRGEINHTTKKFGNQKGGGGARHGSRKAGIFVGGGKAFGPRFRSHETSLNKKVRALGLRHALSTKAKASLTFSVLKCTWPPATAVIASLPLLKDTYLNLAPVSFSSRYRK